MINSGYKVINRELKVFSGNANPALANEICDHLKIPLGEIHLAKFSDGELYCQILENVRGADVFVVQPTCTPVDRHLFELLLMIGGASDGGLPVIGVSILRCPLSVNASEISTSLNSPVESWISTLPCRALAGA